jgi:hypothetical protein
MSWRNQSVTSRVICCLAASVSWVELLLAPSAQRELPVGTRQRPRSLAAELGVLSPKYEVFCCRFQGILSAKLGSAWIAATSISGNRGKAFKSDVCRDSIPVIAIVHGEAGQFRSKIQLEVIAREIFAPITDLSRKLVRCVTQYKKTATLFRWRYNHVDHHIKTITHDPLTLPWPSAS